MEREETCEICGMKMIAQDGEKAKICVCEVCGRYNLDNCGNEPVFTDRQKLVLRYYFAKLSSRDSRRLNIISSNNIDEIISGIDYPKNLLDKIYRVLSYMVEQTQYFEQNIIIDIKKTYRLLFCENEAELNSILGYLNREGFVRSLGATSSYLKTYIISPIALDFYEKNIISKVKSKQCFVAMWFNEKEDTDNYRFNMNKIYNEVIKPAIEFNNEYKSLRIDCLEYCEDINDKMVAEIRKSRFMVADLTGYRGGVYWEAGFAEGLGIPVIYTCHEKWLKTSSEHLIEGVHFDLEHRNIILWNENNLDIFEERLKNRIEALIYD